MITRRRSETEYRLVYDAQGFISHQQTPFKSLLKPATVVAHRLDNHNIEIIDIIFDHRPDIISHGHFLFGTKLI